MTKKILCFCLLGLLHLHHVFAVKITSLDVPRYAWDPVIFNCRYSLEGDDKFYAVKWYKDNVEFFRCLANGTVHEFPLQDIKLYYEGTSQPGACYFQLIPLSTTKSGGEYMCEVSLDWPTFKTVTAASRVVIKEPPRVVVTQTEAIIEPEVKTVPITHSKGSTQSLNQIFTFVAICILCIVT